MEVSPIRLLGNWRDGWALDQHTVSSEKRPDGGFDNTRTALGEELYRCKYQYEAARLDTLAEVASQFLLARAILPRFAAIVPVPASDPSRPHQPVREIAIRIGRRTNLACAPEYFVKENPTSPLKNIEDRDSRRDELVGAFRVHDQRFAGRWILLFDDVFRSGETLRAATEAALTQGKVGKVYVMTLTKTRTNR